jgi:hypothetical protein
VRRSVVPERIDRVDADPERLAESLEDLAWMNRWLGVTAGVVRELEGLLADDTPGRLTLLDVGTGRGDVPMAASRWWEGRGGAVCAVALDRGGETARIAARRVVRCGWEGRVRVVRGDALRLPFRDRAFDVALSVTTLHHFDPEGAAAVLREMARVSDRGLVVSDLRRCRANLWAARALARTVWRRHPYARHDAPASVRAAYTLREVRGLADRAGLAATVAPQPFFRWALVWTRRS